MVHNIAIIGYGSAGKQHAQAIKNNPLIKLNCIYDLNQDLYISDYPREYSWENIINNREIDTIAICLPPGERKKYVIEALEAKKSVLLEKPPCISEKEFNLFLQKARESRVKIGTMFQHRNIIPKNVLDLNWDNNTTAVLEVSRPRSMENYFKEWRKQPVQSLGGIVAHLGVHYLDLAIQILGEPKNIIELGRKEYLPGIETHIGGLIEFRSGAVMSFIVTADSHKRNERLAIFGKDKFVKIENGKVTTQIFDHIIDHPYQTTENLRKRLYKEFCGSPIGKENSPMYTLERSRGITILLEHLYR